MTSAPPTLAEILRRLDASERERSESLANLSSWCEANPGDAGGVRRYDEARADVNEQRADDLDKLMCVARAALAAIDQMADQIGDGWTASDVGEKFTCREADSIATVMLHGGLPEAAFRWLRGHAIGDDCGDAHHHMRALDYLHQLQTGAQGAAR